MQNTAINIVKKSRVTEREEPKTGHSKINVNKVFSQPMISIIIPVYFEEKILEDTLKHYPRELLRRYNAELIISDGGSEDKTIEIASKYADRVYVHKGKARQTIAEGRNKGAEIANGDIFVFINGDTIPSNPELFFNRILNWFESDSGLSDSVALACAVTVRPEDKILKDSIFYYLHNSYVKLLNSVGIGMGRGECQIIRAEYFRMVNGYNSQLTAGEDFDLYRRIAKLGKIRFTKDIVVFESPRRFRKYGYLRILFSWLLNSLSVMFRNRSVSKEWEAVR